MAKFDFGKKMKLSKETLQEAVNSAKTKAKEVKIPDVRIPDLKVAQDKVQQVKDTLKRQDKVEESVTEVAEIKTISNRNAIKIFYYLMAADGRILPEEEEKFDAIGIELDPYFKERKNNIVKECQIQLDKVIDPEDYYDALQDGIEEALHSSRMNEDSNITPKWLIWNMLTIAYSDGEYDERERRLLKYVVRKLNIDKAVFLELENSILTLMDLEKELEWLKSTDRPYLTIEMMVNEIADRKNVIFESVKDLIML